MASGSRSLGCGSHTESPSPDNALIGPQLDPQFEAMAGAEIIAYLNRSRRAADLDDAALVLAARERRLAEATAQIHQAAKTEMELQAKIRALELRAANAEAAAQICWAAKTEMGLQAEIRALELKAANADAAAQICQAAKTEMGLQPEIRALELKAANVEVHARHGSGISGQKLTLQAGVIKEAYGEEVDRKVVDVLGARVIEGHKVPKQEAQGEDVEASHHRYSHGEQPVRATKKVRKQTGPSFYNMVFNELKERQELLQQKWNEEAIAKEAVATASNCSCRCWWSSDMKEDSNNGPNDS